jgi:hypothetical protein
MSVKSKSQLTTENQQNFPTNNTGYITAVLLREFNQDVIDSFVDEIEYNIDSASVEAKIQSLENFTSSLSGDYVTTGSFNTFTQSVNNDSASFASEITDLQQFSSSLDATFVNESEFGTYTQSQALVSQSFSSRVSSLEQFSSSLDTNFVSETEFGSFTSSYLSTSASFATRIDDIEANSATGSFTTSATWSFDHNLGQRLVLVQVYDDTYSKIIPQDIELTSENNATITFPSPISGWVIALK